MTVSQAAHMAAHAYSPKPQAPEVPQRTLWLAPGTERRRRRREGEGIPHRTALAGRLIVRAALSKLERLVELMDLWTLLIINVTQPYDGMF